MSQFISVKRKQQTNKHAPLAIMLCLLFLFSSFNFCFAVDADLFVPQITENSNTALRAEGAYYGKYGSSGWSGYVGCVNYDDVIYGVFTTPNTTDGLSFYVVTNHSDAVVIHSTSNSSKTSTPLSLYEGSEDIYIGAFQNINSSVWIDYSTVPIYESLEDMVSYFEDDVIGGGGGGVLPTYATIIVNPGNVAYIGYDEGYVNITARTSKAMRKYNGNARIGYTSSRPTSNSQLNFTSSTGTLIDFTPVQPFDLAHRTTVHQYHETLTTTAYLVVYNPIYDADGNANLPLNVGVSQYLNVVQFPLTATIQNGEIISQGDIDNFYASQGADMMPEAGMPEYVYSQTDSQGNVTTSTAISVPTSPYNYLPVSEDNDTTMRGFIERILNILSAPLEHIQRLYNSAINFFNYLTSLWSWLPSELTSIIISALVVLVVIGVVKFLWK